MRFLSRHTNTRTTRKYNCKTRNALTRLIVGRQSVSIERYRVSLYSNTIMEALHIYVAKRYNEKCLPAQRSCKLCVEHRHRMTLIDK